MKKESKKLFRSGISAVLSFLLAIIFTVGSVAVGIYVGFLSENRIIDGLNYKDYYSSVEAAFYQNAKDITMPIGLPDTVVEGIVESEAVHSDVKNYVVSSVNGKAFTFNTTDLRRKLEQNVRDYFVSQNVEMSPEQEATIPEYTNMIAEEYVSTLKVPFVEHFADAKNIVRKVLLIVLPVCIVLAAIIIFMLLRMRKWKHRGVRYIVYSSVAAGIMVALPGIAALISGFYKKINITSEYLYYAFTKYISSGLWVFVYLALIWVAAAVCLLFLIRFLKSHKN